jgi:AcrR family transcriptional regulator
MGRPRIHDEQTREALLSAAEQLLVRGGLDAVSTRAVAEKAGTTTRAVYSLFGSKPELLRQLAARAFGLLADLVEPVPQTGDPGADLINVGMTFRDWALAHPNLFRLVFALSDTGLVTDSAVAPAGQAALGQLRKRVEQVHAAGLLADRRVGEVVVEWHALCAGLASVELGGALVTAAEAEHMWRESLTAFLHGLSQPSAQPVATARV